MRGPILCVCFLAGASFASGQANLPKLIDALASDELAGGQTRGLVIGASIGGQVSLIRGYGVANVGGNAPDGNTEFYIGSLSGSLTAFGFMKLVDEKRISLDDSALKYLTELPKAWRGISIREYLAQTSGVPSFRKGLSSNEYRNDTWLDSLDRTEISSVQFAPGSRELFEPGNMAVVAKLIEKVSGKPYMLYMREEVFEPLGMNHTGLGFKASAATGFIHELGNLREAEPIVPTYLAPSIGLQSSADDLLKWEQAMFKSKILSPASYKAMFHPYPAADGKPLFALGWRTRKLGNDLVAFEGGGSTGFDCKLMIDLTRGDAAVALRNTSGGPGNLERMCVTILRSGMGAGTRLAQTTPGAVVTPRRNGPASGPATRALLRGTLAPAAKPAKTSARRRGSSRKKRRSAVK